MDRIAVSGTVDAGSIPAWSAKVTTLCDMYEQVLGGLCPPAELISQRVVYFVQAAELISEGLLRGVMASEARLRN